VAPPVDDPVSRGDSFSFEAAQVAESRVFVSSGPASVVVVTVAVGAIVAAALLMR
jgi:hypothetical protein